MKYAVIVTSEKCEKLHIHDGQEFLVTKDDWGATGSYCNCGIIPDYAMIFDSHEAADKFGKEWEGHPWWVKPTGYRVVEVVPNMVSVQRGWILQQSQGDS